MLPIVDVRGLAPLKLHEVTDILPISPIAAMEHFISWIGWTCTTEDTLSISHFTNDPNCCYGTIHKVEAVEFESTKIPKYQSFYQ